MLSSENSYSRKSNIIYENGIAILSIKINFIDVEKFTDTIIDYTNRSIEMFPELYEPISNKPKENEQLSFF